MEIIKILIVDDDIEWLKMTSDFLNSENDFRVVATATTKNEAITMAKTTEIDIILMDLNLENNMYDGIDAVTEILKIKKVKIIMVTEFNEKELIAQSFSSGAVNFLSKRKFRSKICDAIREAYNNDSPYEVLLKEYQRLLQNERLKDFTPAEKEIFDLIIQGYENNQIASKLFKSEGTLNNQITSILKKCNVKNRRELMRNFGPKS